MDILIFGGTGAMGRHLTNILSTDESIHITVTSRKRRDNFKNVEFVEGNAKDYSFAKQMCSRKKWDAIVDFMIYSIEELEAKIDMFLNSTKQYFFISSARVYADNDFPIKESDNRLIEVSKDADFLNSNEYSLRKAKEEDIFINHANKNWTIIRPGLTYGENRIQLGVYEKENWLYRAINGRSIVFSKDLLDKRYTMTYGLNVAEGIAGLIGKNESIGEIFTVAINKSYTWREILDFYLDCLEENTGIRPKVVLTDLCTNLDIEKEKYQVLYGRYFNRTFDNSKLSELVDTSRWLTPDVGLKKCLSEFLTQPSFSNIDWLKEALIDRAANEWTPLSEIPGIKLKIRYLQWRIFGYHK